MKKVAIFLENLFNEEELIYPYHRLSELYDVDLIAPEKQEAYRSSAGFLAYSTKSIDDVNADDYDALFIPGGYSPDKMRKNDRMRAFTKEFDAKEKPIGAICHAGWMLASCCDLKNKEVTSVKTIADDLIHAGGKWVDEKTVVSGHLVTARSPEDLKFMLPRFIEVIENQ